METILIWLGSGFAFSVGVVGGIFVAVFAMGGQKNARNEARETIELMKVRNELDSHKVAAMIRGYESVENLCEILASIKTV